LSVRRSSAHRGDDVVDEPEGIAGTHDLALLEVAIVPTHLYDLGFARASDIDGGLEAWQAAGLSIEVAAD
jgi:hypothetical protein